MKVRPTFPLIVVLVGLLASAMPPRTSRAQQRGPGVGRAAAASAGEHYYALVIGNEDYHSLPRLGTAARDARAVERVLRESYGFQTTLLVNATRSDILSALSGYGRKLGADASLLVYYAGRGYRDAKAGKAYWLPVDATRVDVSTRVAADEITNGIRAAAVRHVLVVSDSCYSGTLPYGFGVSPTSPAERERFLQKMSGGRSRMLMASGGDEPVAYAGNGGHSVFSAALLRGLRLMGGPRFTASELFVEYVQNPVAGRTGKIPAYNPLRDSGHEGGDFVFKRIKPVPAPDSCDDLEAKEKLYKTFIHNFKGDPEQQKVAHGAGREYVSLYARCTEEDDRKVVAYIRNWVTRYEAAVREWERGKERRRP